MPSAADPTPYIDSRPLEQSDYFGHRVVSSPLVKDRFSQLSQASSTLPRDSTSRKPVGSSPGRRRFDESSQTILHTSDFVSQQRPGHGSNCQQEPQSGRCTSSNMAPSEPTLHQQAPNSPVQYQNPFLGEPPVLRIEDTSEREATAISFRSVSMKQVQIRQPLVPSLSIPNREQCITSLSQLPPVVLKDPVAARTPSNSTQNRVSLQIWAPPTITKTEPDKPLSSNISTTTTTGYDHLQHLHVQFDGPEDSSSEKGQSPQHKSSKIPLRTSSHRSRTQSRTRSAESPISHQGTATSSEHQLAQTKERTARLCQMASSGGEKIEMKNIPISISTSQTPEKQKEGAHNAALLAFQHFRHQLAVKKSACQKGDALTPPKIRRKTEVAGDTNRGHMAAQGRQGGTGSLASPSKWGKHQRWVSTNSSIGAPKLGGDDKLIVRHPEPNAEKKAGKETGEGRKAVVAYQRKGASPVKRVPVTQRPQLLIGEIALGMIQNAWLLVEPVFNPRSSVRKRFVDQRMTTQDVGLFLVAALFAGGMLLVVVAFARVVAIGLQIVRSFGALFRLLAGI